MCNEKYTFYIKTKKLLMRHSALIFWRFSGTKCFHFVLVFYETFLLIGKEFISLYENGWLIRDLEYFKGVTKLQRKIIFVSATNIGRNTINILNYYFSKKIYTLAHQTKYLHIEN